MLDTGFIANSNYQSIFVKSVDPKYLATNLAWILEVAVVPSFLTCLWVSQTTYLVLNANLQIFGQFYVYRDQVTEEGHRGCCLMTLSRNAS